MVFTPRIRARSIWRLAAALSVALLAVAFVAACGDDDDDDGGGNGGENGENGDAGNGGNGSGGATEITVIASGTSFGVGTLEVAADTAFTVTFDNQDAGIPHSFAIFDDDGVAGAEGERIATTGIFGGVATETVEVRALPAGDYRFQCEVHANMTGTLTAE